MEFNLRRDTALTMKAGNEIKIEEMD